MDRVTTTYLEAFRDEQSLGKLDESTAFEHFATYCVVSDAFDDEFNVTDFHAGGGDDLGIDGVAVLVNGSLVSSVEELEELLKLSGTLDVTFLFVQAKTSSSFSAEQIGTFLDGVEEFFSESPKLPMNEEIANAREVMQAVYKNSLKFKRGKPSCRMSFVTTGQWTGAVHLQAKIDTGTERIRSTGLFSSVTVTPMGADELHASYLRSKNSVTSEFLFPEKVLLPEISGVDEAYLGVLPVSEFLKLITDEAGNIRKSLFTDNVRDFQDYNAVNTAIQRTLQDVTDKERFVVLNNGITVVARDLKTTRDKVTISDYQIVNGCQTSHVLFDEQENVTDTVQVPLKIIATQDEDVINAIITATNRQTQVTAEDLYALGGFAKKLESFFSAYGDKKKLYYERRSKQYNSVPGVEKVRIVTKVQLIRAFAAMFLDEPHRATGYYSELQSQVGEKIFNEDHKLEPYYLSAYAHYKLEYFFRNGTVPVYYKPMRFHLLMAFRYLAGGADLGPLNANKTQRKCNEICEILWDNAKAAAIFAQAVEIIEEVANGARINRDLAKTRGFTDLIKSALKDAVEASKGKKG